LSVPPTTADAPDDTLGQRLRAAFTYYLPSVLVMLALLLVWQLAVQWLGVKEYILPTPLAALRTLADPNYRWTANFLATLWSVLGAFALSAVLGVLLAIVIVWNDLLMRTVMPVLVLFNTLPKIALAPLFVVWLGYGVWPNIVIGTTIAFFPMVVNTAVGLASAEPEMLDLVRTLRASRWTILRKIRFPNAVPYIFVGLKLNATMSVIGALVGEFVASDRGLGSLIITSGVTLQTAAIFASLTLISVLGLVLYGVVVAVERVVAPWTQQA
jgi:NitT/TauT family transport system permease protein